MKTNIQKLISIIISLIICCSLVNLPVATAEEIPGWTLNSQGGASGWMEIDTEESASGAASMKIINNTPASSNVYINVVHTLKLTAGKSYDIQLQVKSKNSASLKCVLSWDKRYNLLPFGQTYDWTNFEFTYTAKSNENNFISILLEGVTEGVWVDDIIVKEKGTSENLVSNSTFEPEGGVLVQEGTDVADGSLVGVYNTIRASESFTIEDMETVRGAFKYMPVYRAQNITIDGNPDDWENYPALSMPTLPTQYQVYINDGKAKDVEAKSRFAFDDEKFYFMIEVTDDKYVYFTGDSDYWKGDSIQLTLSEMDEKYGSELGLVHDPEKNTSKVVGTVINQQESSAYIKLATAQKDNKTIYEMEIPWHVKFGEIPEQFLFDFLINDNDGDGRRYAAELAPGIAEGKVNALFPVLEIMNTDKDWYGWIESDRSAYLGEEEKFDYYLVNQGEEKTFTVENNVNGEVEEVVVPANSGIRREISHVYEEAGEYDIEVKIKSGDEEFVSKTFVKSEKKPPDNAYAEKLIQKLEANAKELKDLIEQCDVRGISTDYEMISYMTIDKFAGFIRDDIANKDLSRVYYTEDTTDALYAEAKETLEAYIAGEKEPKAVPRYITSDMRIDGKTTWALAEYNGEIEERPTYFIGYGHFTGARKDVPVFNAFGSTAIQNEIGPSQTMILESPWTVYKSKSPKTEYSLENGDVTEGKSALKVSYSDAIADNQYISFYQSVPVEEGKSYEMTFKMKGHNVSASGVFYTPDNFNGRIYAADGTYDWTDFTAEYTAPAGATSTVVRFLVQGPVGEILIDDVKFAEKGSDKNLLKDGGFEAFGKLSYKFNENSGALKTILNMLEEAEKYNVAASVLISPHYFMTDLIEAYDIGTTKPSFIKYNVNADIARQVIEEYLRNLIPLIKDYKSLNNICISNEPQFWVDSFGDYYLQDWQDYLREVYENDIAKLNTAYKKSYADFNEIDFIIYEGDLAKNYDYKRYNDKVFSEWHRWMADIIHEIAPDIPLNTKIMAYVARNNTATAVKFQNNGTGYSEYTDFLEINGCDAWNFIESFMPLEKNMWYDYSCSIKNAPILNSEDHLTEDGSTALNSTVSNYITQDIYQGAIHGRYMTNIWAWERTYDRSSALYGHVLHRPDAVKLIGDAALDLNRLAYEITALSNEEAEVGILYSDADLLHNRTGMHGVYESYAAALYNGKPVKFIVESTVDTMNDYKLIIVPNTNYISKSMLDKLNEYVNNGGKVVLLGDNDALKWDEHALEHDNAVVQNIKNKSQLVSYIENVGMHIDESSAEYGNIIRKALEEEKLYYVSVVDTATNEPVYEVEYNVGGYNKNAIVNLVNYTPDRNVNIYINGELVKEAIELRSGEKLGETILLKQYVPITLQIEKDNILFDTYGHWAEDNIKELSKKGIVYGVNETRYKPDNKTTRAQFLALILRAAEFEAVEYKNTVADVDADDWFAKDVAVAVKNGVINAGEPFRPNENITREEMCEILIKCYEVKKGTVTADTSATFTDADSIDNKAVVDKAVSLELMYGRDDGSFGAKNFATRAEAAAVVERFMTNL